MLFSKRFYKALMPITINSTVRLLQVCVMGGASDIGQIVSLMLRTEPYINKLVIHDTAETATGVVIELSHIPAKSTLKGYLGESTIRQALSESDLVLLVGALIKTPGVTDKKCLEANIEFVKTISSYIGKLDKMPFVGIATEPINTMVPMAAEVLRHVGTFDSKKLFGITTIDWIRAQTLFAMIYDLKPDDCFVPVVGGHSKKTLIPLISQSKPGIHMDENDYLKFVMDLQNYDEVITQAKHGMSPTTSIAYSVMLFVRDISKALSGKQSQVKAYVENNDLGTSYFSGVVNVDSKGIKEMEIYTQGISPLECKLLEKALVELRKDVAKGKKALEWEPN